MLSTYFRRLYLLPFLLLPLLSAQAQQLKTDTLQQLPAAQVRAYLSTQPYLQVSSSLGLIGQDLLNLQQGNTLLPALNTIPGVRMEERSPGSYRLSIRGSLLRSPFGIRNVKIYLDEIPLTDAGGNTYLNSIDPSALHDITVLKGPDGSLYGANSGGVILISPNGFQNSTSSSLNLRESAGSYGLFQHAIGGNYVINDHYSASLDYGYQRADGYRENTASHRHYLQTAHRIKYSDHNELRVIGLYSSMAYQTPGGLTESQYLDNPRQARPTAGPNPGSVEQKAAIYNNTLLGGLVHEAALGQHFKQVTSLFGSYTDFKNPFITNYEQRYESNYGFRTYFSYNSSIERLFVWQAHLGMEWQQGKSDILNYDNNGGIKGNEQAGDVLKNHQHFYFLRLAGQLAKKLNIESALSVNYYHYNYRGLFPQASPSEERVDLSPTWMPRFALSYLFTPQFSWRASVGRGFSPPASSEIRASNEVINPNLQPETGWNKETGFRWQSRNNRFQLDASAFSYRMQQAIVRLLDDGGQESYTNAGGIKQRGLEAAVNVWVIEPNTNSLVRGLRLSTNFTWSHFRFDHYVDADNDYSGNKLTGVPSRVVVSGLHVLFPKQIGLYMQHNYTSSIPLDDANTAYAKSYHLLQGKLSWQHPLFRHTTLQVFGGVDNILNQTYSLGNDLNAFGGRFYNAAMPRNYYAGFGLSI